MAEARTVAFHTLGCKLNFSETSTLSRMLENEGFEKKEFDDQADVYVINTCSVTDNADKECRQIDRRIQRKAPESLVVITGCYAQLKPKQIAEIPGVNLVLGAAEKFNLAQHIRELSKGDSAKICSCDIEDVTGFNSSSPSMIVQELFESSGWLRLQLFFCTIPQARGKSRSDSIENVLKNVAHLARME
jgi:threonylcarbamoyladenosine tRNA methylthiotransferase MtaB